MTPQAALRPCATPRCPKLVVRGHCPDHARQRDQRRGTATQRGYDKVHWGPARDAFLREYPLCGMRPHNQPPVMSQCHEQGRVTPATQVDHVVPHKGDPAKFWDRANLQSLCSKCHSAKTAREDGGFGR
jgi:5-methylcytosine-specific restriction protein A